MKKKVLQIVMCVMPVLCLYGCGVFIPLGETDVLKLSESTSYYSNYVSENEDMILRVKSPFTGNKCECSQFYSRERF